MKYKYRLKDKELQTKLDEISGGDFSARLNELVTDWYAYWHKSLVASACITVTFGENRKFSARFAICDTTTCETKPVPYNPHKWNKYSDVTPPEGVLMRVERSDYKFMCATYELFIDGGGWCDPDGRGWPDADSERVIHFRPWYEEDEE